MLLFQSSELSHLPSILKLPSKLLMIMLLICVSSISAIAADDIVAITKLAESGDAEAQRRLANMYYRGQDVEQNFDEALKWFRELAEAGDVEAQNKLGGEYSFGMIVEQSDKEAVKWYGMAAAQGYEYAQSNLAHKYAGGQGVEKDAYKAYVLFSMAFLTHGHDHEDQSKNSIENARSEMTSAQIIKADAVVKQCHDSQYKQCDFFAQK